ncbi:MAG: hypothetical protein NC818_00110 [Candidatus Omnitrophica bacterium]|nr:hypothetical protein [Candidatus Omnitrophota bacterium]
MKNLAKKIISLLLVELFLFSQTNFGLTTLLSPPPQHLSVNNNQDNQTLLLPPPLCVDQQSSFPSSVVNIPEERIRAELKPLIEKYLEDTNRSLNDLNTVVNNFSYLVIGGDDGLDLFALEEVKAILEDSLTRQLETPLAQFLGKAVLDLSQREAVVKLSAWSGLYKAVGGFLNRDLKLEDIKDQKALNDFALLIAEKGYALGGIKRVLGDEKVKALYSLEEICNLLSQLRGGETTLTLLQALNGNLPSINNFTPFSAIPTGYEGGFSLSGSRRSPADAEIGFIVPSLELTNIAFKIKIDLEEGSVMPAVKLELVDAQGNKATTTLDEVTDSGKEYTISRDRDDFKIDLITTAFDWSKIERVSLFLVTGGSSQGKITLSGLDAFLLREKKEEVLSAEKINFLLNYGLLGLKKWELPLDIEFIKYIGQLLDHETTRKMVANWMAVLPYAPQLIWRDLFMEGWNIKDEGILGYLTLTALERTGKNKLSPAEILATIQSLVSEFEKGDFGISEDRVLVQLMENALGRKLDFKSYMDVMAYRYWSKLRDLLGQEFVSEKLNSRSLAKSFPKLGDKIELIRRLASAIGFDIKLMTSNPDTWDWFWKEMAIGTSPDMIVDIIWGGFVFKELLEGTLWIGEIDVHHHIEQPFWRYFVEYLPYSGASKEQVVKFILEKYRNLPYDSVAVGFPEVASYGITTAGRTSYNVEAQGHPFTADETKRMLLLYPAINQLLSQLIGLPQQTAPVLSIRSFFTDELDRLLNYFLEARDFSSGAMADALSGVDNSTAAGGFLVMAAIIAAEVGKISKDEANKIIGNFVKFISVTQKMHGLLSHYTRGGTAERAGNSEFSLIDTYLAVSALIAYRNWQGAEPEVVKAINAFLGAVQLEALQVQARTTGLMARGGILNFGVTPERGFTGGIVDFYNEYILCYLIAIGQTDNPNFARDMAFWFYKGITRKQGSGVSEEAFTYPFENSLFQFQYPLVFLPMMFLSDIGSEFGTTDLNHFRNAVSAFLNTHATAVKEGDKFRSFNYHSWAMNASAALASYYSMVIGMPPRDKDGGKSYYDGTISPNATFGGLPFMPYLSYQSLRYLTLAFPQAQGRYGFVDSLNPERNWFSPTYFSLGQGLALMGIWDTLNYGRLDRESAWSLNLRDKFYLKSLFELGFREDLSPQFSAVYQELINGALGIEEAVKAIVTEKDYAVLREYLTSKGLDTTVLLQKWQEIGPWGSSLERGAVISFIRSKIADGRLDNAEIQEILRQARSIADYNLIAEVLLGDPQKNNGLMQWAYDKERNIYKLKSDEGSPNYLLFPLLMQLRIEQTKLTLSNVFSEPEIVGKQGLDLAQAYLDKVEEIARAAQLPDERAIFAFQHFTEKAEGYYAKAIEILQGLIDGKIDSLEEVRAQALLFTAYKKNWQYDQQKEAFKLLAQAVEGNVTFRTEAIDIIASYFGREILADYYQAWVHPQKALTSEQETKVKEAIATALQYPDPDNPPAGKSYVDVLLNNKISLIFFREKYLRQPVVINPYDATQAGQIGYFVTQLFTKGASEEQIVGMLTEMLRYKPLVESVLGRELDLQNNRNDLYLLSLAVALSLQNLPEARIAEIIGGTIVSPENLETAIAAVQNFMLARDLRAFVDKTLQLSRYLRNKENVQIAFDPLLGKFLGQDLPTEKWTDFLIDILTVDNIEEYLTYKVIGELNKIEKINIEKNAFYERRTTRYRYKDAYFGDNTNLDLENERVREILDKAFIIKAELEAIYQTIINVEESSLDHLLLTSLVRLSLDSKVNIEELLGSFTATLRSKGMVEEKAQKIFLTFILPNMPLSLISREGFEQYVADVVQLAGELRLSLSTAKDLAVVSSIVNLKYAGIESIPQDIKELSVHYQALLRSPKLADLRTALGPWAGVVLPELERILGIDLTLATGEQISQAKQWLNVLTLPEFSQVASADIDFLKVWANIAKEAKIIAQLRKELEGFKDSAIRFLEQYVLGETFNSSNPQHQEKYWEWIGYRMPYVMECMHKFMKLDTVEEQKKMFVLGSSVDATIFKLSTPQTLTVLRRREISPVVQALYGEGDIREAYRFGDSPITEDNYAYRALLSYYAELTDKEGNYLPLSLLATTLLLEKELVRDAGLEALYQAHFNLVTGLPTREGVPLTGAIDVSGISGFYVSQMEQWAGLGALDYLLAYLMKTVSLSEAERFVNMGVASAIDVFLTTGQLPPIQGLPSGIMEIFAPAFGDWLLWIKENYAKALLGFSEEDVRRIIKNDTFGFITKALNQAYALKESLASGDSANIESVLVKLFNLDGNPALMEHLRKLLEEDYNPEDSVKGFDSLRLLAQIAQISTIVRPSEDGKFQNTSIGRVGLRKELEILSAVRGIVEKEFGTLDLLRRIDAVWVISGFATPVIYGEKTIGQIETEIKKIATAYRMLRTVLPQEVFASTDPLSLLSSPFMSGVLSFISQRLPSPAFNITFDVDLEYIVAYLTDAQEKQRIDRLYKAIVDDKEGVLKSFLINPVNTKDVNQAGFVSALVNRAWRLIKDKGLTEEQAIGEVNKWLEGIREFLVSAGLHTADYVAEIIADYRKMGLWSYYLSFINPVAEQELAHAQFSPTFPDFVSRYNYSLDAYLQTLPNYSRIPEAQRTELKSLWDKVLSNPTNSGALERFRDVHERITGYSARVFVENFVIDQVLKGKDVSSLIAVANGLWSDFRIKDSRDLEKIIWQLGYKPDWSDSDWQKFKALYERYLETTLFTSQAYVLPTGEEAQALELFLSYYLSSRLGENRMSSLEAMRFHQWAVLVNTFGKGTTIEEKWENFFKEVVLPMRQEIEALMPDYFGRDPVTGKTYFDKYNPVHGGVVAYFIEQALFKMFMNREQVNKQWSQMPAQRGWLVGPRFDQKGNRIAQKVSNPYNNPQEFLRLVLDEVLADLKVAVELKPYVEKARMAFIDVTDPRMAGILWFHVNTLKDPPRDWTQFSSLGTLKSHLEKEARIMLTLAQQGRYLDIFSPEDMGELSYYAQEGGMPLGKSLRLEKLTPENAFVYFAYPQWSKLLLGQTDSAYARINELAPTIKRLIASNPYWRDGLTHWVTDGYGFDYAFLLQIKEELGIAYLLQAEVAKFFGVEKLDFNNQEHLAMLWEYTQRTYLKAKGKLEEEIRAGRVANVDSERGWSMLVGDTGKNVSKIVLEKYGLDLTSPGWDKYSPLRFWILEMASAVIPEVSYELRVLKAVRPIVETIEKRALKLNDSLDMRLLENYKEIALALGREIVLNAHREEIENLGKEAILRTYEKVVRGLIQKGDTKEKAEARVLFAYRDQREALGKTVLFAKYREEAVNLGVQELARRAGLITQQAPPTQQAPVEVKPIEPPKPPEVPQPPETPRPPEVPQPLIPPEPEPEPEPFAPQTLPTVPTVTITQTPSITLAFEISNGLSLTWSRIKDSQNREVSNYQWEILDAKGNVVRSGETSALSTWIKYEGLLSGNYLFRVRGVIREKGIFIEGEWSEHSFSVEGAREQTTETPAAEGKLSPVVLAPFVFKGTISGGGNLNVGEESIFNLWGNYNELDSGYIIIREKNTGREIERIVVNSGDNRYRYSWTNAGQYVIQLVGTKAGATYNSNEIEVWVKQPTSATSVTSATTTSRVPVAVNWSAYQSPEINPRVSDSENVRQRVSHYQGTTSKDSTARFWSEKVFASILATVRDRQKAFVLTDMTMFAFTSVFGTLPNMTEKGAGIWHNEIIRAPTQQQYISAGVFAQNLVIDWTTKATNYFRMNYYSGCNADNLIKKAIEEANRFVWERQHLYF